MSGKRCNTYGCARFDEALELDCVSMGKQDGSARGFWVLVVHGLQCLLFLS